VKREMFRSAQLVSFSVPLLAWSGCRAPSGGAAPQECAAVSSELPPGSSARNLAGEYQLRLVATAGVKKGSAANGTLKLQQQGEGLRYRLRPGGTIDSAVVHPLYGATEVDLSAVDAVRVGSTTSEDPMEPGVLVVERHAREGQAPMSEIVLRLGSDANRRDRQRVDGGYTALRVRQVSPDGFSGTWGSGIAGEQSAGFFCAVRKNGNDGKDGKDGNAGY
jgi:hypothetical protein